MIRHVVGCMTGTSLDGLDVALVEIEGNGLQMQARVLRGHAHGLAHLGPILRDLADQKPLPAGVIAATQRTFSLLHLEAVRALLGTDSCHLVAVHGQTVVHVPPVSWQLFQPAPLAYGMRVPVVCDFRAADLARGGQGAPITPLSDWVFLHDSLESRVVVNLGGFCNVTVLPAGGGPEQVHGFDVCACNQLLDGIARRCLGSDFDRDGREAMSAKADAVVAGRLFTALDAQAKAGRSLGTGDELERIIGQFIGQVSGPVLARSACVAIASVVVERGGPGRYLLAGGGVHNRALVEEFRSVARAVDTTDTVGLPGAWREAAAMAVLGALCQDRVAITLPQVTGLDGPAPIAGCWVLP